MSKTLLAVDDSKTMRTVLEMTFAGEGYTTLLAGDAEDALGKLAAAPNLAIVDAGLAGTDGYELCQKLKLRAPGVRVLLLSSKYHPFDPNRAAKVGVDDHCDKPFESQALIDKVSALLQRGPVARTADLQTVRQAVRRTTPPPKPGMAPVAAKPVDAPRLAVAREPLPARPAAPQAVPRPPMEAAPAQARAAQVAPLRGGVQTAPAANGGPLASKLATIGLTPAQIEAVIALSREVIEQVVWEIVPDLAETIIREEIRRLTSEA